MNNPYLLIREYVETLSHIIGRRLPDGIKAERLREVEGHLRMAAEEIGVEKAIRNYGSPRVVAGALVRVERGYVGVSPTRLALGVSLLICVSLVLQMNRYDLGLPPSLATNCIWVPPLALAGFALRVAQTRRWLVLSIVPTFAVAWVITLGISSVTSGADPRELSNAKRYLAALHEEQTVLNQWNATGKTPESLIPDVAGVNAMAEIPLLPVLVPNGFRWTYSLVSPSIANSHGGWKEFGVGWAAELPSRINDAEAHVSYLQKSPFQRFASGFTPSRLLTALTFLTDDLLIAFVVNAFGLAVAAASDRRPIRRA